MNESCRMTLDEFCALPKSVIVEWMRAGCGVFWLPTHEQVEQIRKRETQKRAEAASERADDKATAAWQALEEARERHRELTAKCHAASGAEKVKAANAALGALHDVQAAVGRWELAERRRRAAWKRARKAWNQVYPHIGDE